MKQRWFLALGLSLCFACQPVQSVEEPGNSSGGSSGSGSGGKSGGSGGGQSSNSSGGAPGSTGGGSGSSTGGGSGSSTGGGSGSSTGGTTGSSGGNTGSMGSGGSSGGSPDAATMETGGGTPSTGMGPAAALHDYVLKVPCPNQTGTGKSCNIGTDVRAYMKTVMMGGDAATTYKVKLKVCAVYEGKPYTGCMAHPESPKVCINGTPGTGGFSATYPTLALKAGDKTYYLNHEQGYNDKIFKFEYTATFDIKGGSMVTFISDGGSNAGVYTAYQGPGMPTCPGMPPGIEKQPYLGQFAHFQVVSVDPM